MKAGDVLIIETGEYSDHEFHGPFRCLKDFSLSDEADLFEGQYDEDSWDNPGLGGFVPWLAIRGLIEDVDNVKMVHIGSYGRMTRPIDRGEVWK